MGGWSSWRLQSAVLGGVGYLPYAPGTWASLVAVLAWVVVLCRLPLPIYWGMLAGLGAVAVGVSNWAERDLGRDARPIVVDEFVGQLIALSGLPRLWWTVAAAFVLFRFFDVVKPFPIGVSQRLAGGWGVVADDVLAGAAALAAVNAIRALLRV